MLVLKMSEDRNLMITKRGNSYQDENNAENIKIILPKILNEIDLKKSEDKDVFGRVYEYFLSHFAIKEGK